LLVVSAVVFSLDAKAARAPKIQLEGNLSADAPKAVTIEMVEKLPLTTLETYNPFLKRVNSYTGVLLSDLAKAYAAEGVDNIVLTAIDGYVTNFIKDEWDRYSVLLATQVGGKHIEIKDSGPAKIVLDYEKIEDGLRRTYSRKWVWLINSIEFKVGGEAFDDK
jgi:hypothetical protein